MRALGSRGRGVAAALLVACSLAVAVTAWSCVPQAQFVYVQPRSFGPVGTQVTVSGVGLDPGPVEVRWDSADGALLATARGPRRSVPVTIPAVAEGLYHLLVLSRAGNGVLGSAGATTFLVTGPRPISAVHRPRPGRAPRNWPLSQIAGGAGLVAMGTGVGVFAATRSRRAHPAGA